MPVHPFEGSNRLMAYIVGDEARRVSKLKDDEIIDEVYDVMKSMFGKDKAKKAIAVHKSNWINSPWTKGGHSR